ncbi:3-oxoadipate enol-lactonase [Kordiimonas pumila]|uniref:3-oxoadipate enol-lactonase n=1 Tax=Kordiimonas pumila TaxID=2161677 RepID=A0ABV7D501_9PROT|nr:3-oxoadipate enol-lactonase [Kordiimonas pumila]
MFKASDDVDIAYEYHVKNGKPVILFSNSLGTDRSMWAPQVAALSDEFAIVTYDSRGHGLSGAPGGAYSLDRLSLDVLELMDFLKIETAHFCGVSLGGMVGQRLATRAAHRFQSLTLAATSPYMGPPSSWQGRIETVLAEGMEALVEAVISRWFTPAFMDVNPKQVDAVRQVFLNVHPAGYAGCCAAIRDMDMRCTARMISAQTLVVAGEKDPATPPEGHAAVLHSAIPTAQYLSLDGAHLINLEQAEKFTDALRNFVQSA